MDRRERPLPATVRRSGREDDGALREIAVDATKGGGVALQLRGEIDLSNVSALASAIAKHRQELSVLDLRQVDFIDCRGVSVVIEASTRAQARGDRLRILPGPAVQRVASLLRDASRLDTA